MFESHPDITIRTLSEDDRAQLVRLSQRDSALPPEGTVLAAIDPGGMMLAAISLDDGELVADPFLPTAHAAGLLRVRARQLQGATLGRRLGAGLRNEALPRASASC